MAYSATVTVSRKGNDFVVQIVELEAGTATEATITGIPLRGRLLRQKATLTAGSGSTVDPILGNAANPTAAAASIIVVNATAAATIDNISDGPGAPYVASTGSMYHRSVCDSGSDNSVTTLYYLTGASPATGW